MAREVRLGNYIAYGSNDFLGAGAMSIIGLWVAFFVSRLKAHPLMSPRQESALHHELAHTQHQH